MLPPRLSPPHRPLLSLSIAFAAGSAILLARMASSTSNPPSSGARYDPQPYTPRHKTWPYTQADFDRQDPSSDTSFYAPPRFVTHIDDAAISSLRSYYDTALPTKGRILDFCSSWISHFPPRVSSAAACGALSVTGMGMNQAELARNPVLSQTLVQDLNADPRIPDALVADGPFDAATCVVSIDYLVRPVEVLRSLREKTRPGGAVHLVVSNRCFPTKAVARWLRVDEGERLRMVGDYLHFAGWEGIEILDLKAVGEGEVTAGGQKGLKDVMGMLGFGGEDPLWVVRARNGAE